jgi:uncharacterized membrane protein YdjX (TVP38/TMEM64 family)
MSRRLLLKVAAVLALGALFAIMWFSPLREHLTRENVRAAVEEVRSVWYAPILYILLYATACVVVLPASIFVVTAGFIWGWLMGGIYALIGSTLGATISFFVARFIGEGLLDRFGKLGRVVAKQVDHADFRTLLIARNIPGVPFAVLNYGAGVAGVEFRLYFLATVIGIAPSHFVFTYCADALFNGSMSEGAALGRLALVCVLFIAIVLLPRVVRRLAGRGVEQPPPPVR